MYQRAAWVPLGGQVRLTVPAEQRSPSPGSWVGAGGRGWAVGGRGWAWVHRGRKQSRAAPYLGGLGGSGGSRFAAALPVENAPPTRDHPWPPMTNAGVYFYQGGNG